MVQYMFKTVPYFLLKALVVYEMKINLERRKIANKGRTLNQSLSFKQIKEPA